jgi:hypothetical protein
MEDAAKDCPPGFKRRNRFTNKKGREHPSICVKPTGLTPQLKKTSSSSWSRSLNRIECPPGKVLRKSYVRRFKSSIMKKGYTVKRHLGKEYHIKPGQSSVHVKASCVKQNPKPPAFNKIITYLKKGELAKHGYVYLKNKEERHSALKKAVEEFGPLNVYNKLKIVMNLSRYKIPAAASIFNEDSEWLKNNYKL